MVTAKENDKITTDYESLQCVWKPELQHRTSVREICNYLFVCCMVYDTFLL